MFPPSPHLHPFGSLKERGEHLGTRKNKTLLFQVQAGPEQRGHSWSRFPAARLYGAVYNLHNSGQPSKVWCTHWMDWKTLIGSGKHINRKYYIFLLRLFWHVLSPRPPWSESAFSCVNLTSSKELREYLNSFCYGELGSYTVFHTAGIAVLECQRWTCFLWSRKLFVAWLKSCMCMFGREKGAPVILDLSQMFENWLTSLGLLSLFLFHWFSWVYMLYLLSVSTTQHKFSVLLCKESRLTMAFSHPSNSGNVTFNRSTAVNRIQRTEAKRSPEWCAFSESIFFLH